MGIDIGTVRRSPRKDSSSCSYRFFCEFPCVFHLRYRHFQGEQVREERSQRVSSNSIDGVYCS